MNQVARKIHITKPQNLFVVGGRGFSKTTEILAERFMDVVYDMPRSSIAILSDSYVNAMSNVIPVLLSGLERKGWFEDYHYVVDKKPPLDFENPYLKTFRYKHTISFRNGVKCFIVSGDRPESAAGLSLTHFFIDESKYIKEDTLNRVAPTLRDNPMLYNNSPFFLGMTATTDMPNINLPREYNWILRQEENMDKEQIKLILQTAWVVNGIQAELLKNGTPENDLIEAITQINSGKRVERKYANLKKWFLVLKKLRKQSTLFVKVSSFANADILGVDYYQKLFKTLTFADFLVSVLSIEPSTADIQFFAKFCDRHLFSDGYNYRYYDKFGLKDDIQHTANGLTYYNPKAPLYGGMDFGNMCSLVISQEEANASRNRSIKDFYTLTPRYIKELASDFVKFFPGHHNNHKTLHLYYDRAGNNYGKHGQAVGFKDAVEELNMGWQVKLESIGKATVLHKDVYDIFDRLMDEKTPFELLIDEHNCDTLVCSMEISPLKKDRNGNNALDKASEKTRILENLPKKSTNMATAYIYLIEGRYRKYLPKQGVKHYSARVY